MARTINELIDRDDPAWPLVRSWIEEPDANPSTVLPPDHGHRDDVLTRLQVTTRSSLGAIAYETGGITVHHGWLRLLGSGRGPAARSLLHWNDVAGGLRHGTPDDFVLIADDVLGGFYALNGGRFGPDGLGAVFYGGADGLDWESLDLGYSDFVHWCLSGKMRDFYADFDKLGCWDERPRPGFDEAYAFYPFLWSAEARSASDVGRRPVAIAEIWKLRGELAA